MRATGHHTTSKALAYPRPVPKTADCPQLLTCSPAFLPRSLTPAAVRSVKKGGSKRGATKQGQAAAELAASGVQIRPKRRLPVGEVRGGEDAVGVRAARCPLRCMLLFQQPSSSTDPPHRRCHPHHPLVPSPTPSHSLPPHPGPAGGRRHPHARHPPLRAQHDGAGGSRVCGGPGSGGLGGVRGSEGECALFGRGERGGGGLCRWGGRGGLDSVIQAYVPRHACLVPPRAGSGAWCGGTGWHLRGAGAAPAWDRKDSWAAAADWPRVRCGCNARPAGHVPAHTQVPTSPLLCLRCRCQT